MDTTGESNLAELVRHLQAVGGKLMISGIQPQPLELLKRTGLYSTIGEAQFYPHTGKPLMTHLTASITTSVLDVAMPLLGSVQRSPVWKRREVCAV